MPEFRHDEKRGNYPVGSSAGSPRRIEKEEREWGDQSYSTSGTNHQEKGDVYVPGYGWMRKQRGKIGEVIAAGEPDKYGRTKMSKSMLEFQKNEPNPRATTYENAVLPVSPLPQMTQRNFEKEDIAADMIAQGVPPEQAYATVGLPIDYMAEESHEPGYRYTGEESIRPGMEKTKMYQGFYPERTTSTVTREGKTSFEMPEEAPAYYASRTPSMAPMKVTLVSKGTYKEFPRSAEESEYVDLRPGLGARRYNEEGMPVEAMRPSYLGPPGMKDWEVEEKLHARELMTDYIKHGQRAMAEKVAKDTGINVPEGVRALPGYGEKPKKKETTTVEQEAKTTEIHRAKELHLVHPKGTEKKAPEEAVYTTSSATMLPGGRVSAAGRNISSSEWDDFERYLASYNKGEFKQGELDTYLDRYQPAKNARTTITFGSTSAPPVVEKRGPYRTYDIEQAEEGTVRMGAHEEEASRIAEALKKSAAGKKEQ